MSSSLSDQTNTVRANKRSPWKWWQASKTPDYNDNIDSTSIAPSSLVVHHSIHSKESDDMLSTASIKSKPWISQKLKNTSIGPTQEEEERELALEVVNEVDQNAMDTLQPQNKTETNSRDKITASSPTITITTNSNNNDSTSLLNNAPSVTSTTVPVINFNPHSKGSDNTVFSGIKVMFLNYIFFHAKKF